MVPSQDNLSELRLFINGASRPSNKTDQLELVRTALNLLQTFPAAREAVLEHFCTVIDSAVAKFVINIENQRGEPDGSNEEDATVLEIHDVLCSFVRDNPEAWAPLISAWSLQLLGHLSSRYAGRAGLNPNAGLNETLRLWMSCRATSLLLDATTQCLTPDSVSALLETSAAHGPSFDWAVAHVGSSAPQRVVQRVLACGLRDFARRSEGDGNTLGSVVGILGHLAATRADHIREAVLQLFQSSLEDDVDETLQDATVPYLLRLGSLSPTLLRALTSSALVTLSDPALLPRLAAQAPAWCKRLGGAAALRELAVHLALGCERDAARVVLLLLSAVCDADDDAVKHAAREMLELLLQEMDTLMRSSRTTTVALLGCLRRGSEVSALQPLLLSDHPLRLATAVRLLGLLGEQSPSALVNAGSFLLLHASTPAQLAALARLAGSPPRPTTDILAQALGHALRASQAPGAEPALALAVWGNIETLIKWESRVPSIQACDALRTNLTAAARVLSTPNVDATLAHAVAATLDRCDLGRPTVQLTLRLAQAAVDYFFLCVALPEITGDFSRLRGVRRSCRLLSRLSALKAAARNQALAELTQRALFGREAPLFGATVAQAAMPLPPTSLTEHVHKLGVTTTHAHRVSSAFPVRRKLPPESPSLPTEVSHANVQLLLDVIKAAASDNVNGEVVVSADAMTMLALLTVQLLSSDVMYNGLPWPDEEFCKVRLLKAIHTTTVTVERDLRVRRALDERPAAWALLSLLAANRPSLCYCSVLLRAVCATLIAQWASAGQRNRSELMVATQRLLGVMALGQLLQPPLASMRDIVPTLQPVEILQLLRNCVWGYLRDHVPAPTLFQRDSAGRGWRDPGLPGSRPDRRYTDTLRYVMQTNIQDLGTFYSQLFVHKSTD